MLNKYISRGDVTRSAADVNPTLSAACVGVAMGNGVLPDEDVEEVVVRTAPVSSPETYKRVKISASLSHSPETELDRGFDKHRP